MLLDSLHVVDVIPICHYCYDFLVATGSEASVSLKSGTQQGNASSSSTGTQQVMDLGGLNHDLLHTHEIGEMVYLDVLHEMDLEWELEMLLQAEEEGEDGSTTATSSTLSRVPSSIPSLFDDDSDNDMAM